MRPQPRIILIERDAAVRSALAFSLGLEGYQVQAFERPDAAGLHAMLEDGSCLLLDHDPADPATSGLLHWLNGEGRGCRSVVMATNPCRNLRDRLASAGARLVEKPLIGDGLSNTLRSLFGLAEEDPIQ